MQNYSTTNQPNHCCSNYQGKHAVDSHPFLKHRPNQIWCSSHNYSAVPLLSSGCTDLIMVPTELSWINNSAHTQMMMVTDESIECLLMHNVLLSNCPTEKHKQNKPKKIRMDGRKTWEVSLVFTTLRALRVLILTSWIASTVSSSLHGFTGNPQ